MSVSIAALAITSEQQKQLLEAGWGKLNNGTKAKIQQTKDCCGMSSQFINSTGKMSHPSCLKVSVI